MNNNTVKVEEKLANSSTLERKRAGVANENLANMVIKTAGTTGDGALAAAAQLSKRQKTENESENRTAINNRLPMPLAFLREKLSELKNKQIDEAIVSIKLIERDFNAIRHLLAEHMAQLSAHNKETENAELVNRAKTEGNSSLKARDLPQTGCALQQASSSQQVAGNSENGLQRFDQINNYLNSELFKETFRCLGCEKIQKAIDFFKSLISQQVENSIPSTERERKDLPQPLSQNKPGNPLPSTERERKDLPQPLSQNKPGNPLPSTERERKDLPQPPSQNKSGNPLPSIERERKDLPQPPSQNNSGNPLPSIERERKDLPQPPSQNNSGSCSLQSTDPISVKFSGKLTKEMRDKFFEQSIEYIISRDLNRDANPTTRRHSSVSQAENESLRRAVGPVRKSKPTSLKPRQRATPFDTVNYQQLPPPGGFTQIGNSSTQMQLALNPSMHNSSPVIATNVLGRVGTLEPNQSGVMAGMVAGVAVGMAAGAVSTLGNVVTDNSLIQVSQFDSQTQNEMVMPIMAGQTYRSHNGQQNANVPVISYPNPQNFNANCMPLPIGYQHPQLGYQHPHLGYQPLPLEYQNAGRSNMPPPEVGMTTTHGRPQPTMGNAGTLSLPPTQRNKNRS